ncbi:MAG TPA: hypothetical protein VFH74_15370 [Gaiellales bacterium]|jgi:hypothetical protein|nr:hypothetical protein [Gaiellales bacterium]
MNARPATAQPATELGPVQMLVFEFEQERLAGEIFPELMALVARGLIRLVDMLVVHRPDDEGHLEIVDSRSTFGEDGEEAGEVVAALIGLRSASEHVRARDAIDGLAQNGDDDTWDPTERIPAGANAAIILIEHLWAIPLRDAVGRDRAIVLADEWVHPEDLLAVGGGLPGRLGPPPPARTQPRSS